MPTPLDRIKERLAFLYGPERADEYTPRIAELADDYTASLPSPDERTAFTEKDVFLITYPDQLADGDAPKLDVLKQFMDLFLEGLINRIHILPFFPYSSDDGFSVIDYKAVGEGLGGWDAINRLGKNYKLMADCVLNHISAQSEWVKGYCTGEPQYADFCIAQDPDQDLSMTVRPRALPLLHPFETKQGTEHLWTTFSADQVDLNYANPEVLLRMIDVLFHYIANSADVIRMDAIAYLWKEPGTSCVHLPQTHEVVKLFRDVFDLACPQASIITETNVPHKENISYFGTGKDEAQMVYQFSLPPLTAYALLKEDGTVLANWISSLKLASPETTFFNFTASHDGVGVRPLEGILPPAETAFLADKATAHGGRVSSKTNADGTESPYELNINYHSLLSLPGEDPDISADRFIVSQAIMLAMPGVPAIYFHSIVGSTNWTAGIEETGHNRTINREKLDYQQLVSELSEDKREYIFDRYRELLEARTRGTAFNPYGSWNILATEPQVLAMERSYGEETVLCLFNLSGEEQVCGFDDYDCKCSDIITGTHMNGPMFSLVPFDVLWIIKG